MKNGMKSGASAGMTPRDVAVNPRREQRRRREFKRLQRCIQAAEQATDPAYKERMIRAVEKHHAALRALGVEINQTGGE